MIDTYIAVCGTIIITCVCVVVVAAAYRLILEFIYN